MTLQVEHAFVQTNGRTLHVVQAGPDDGPLLLFLHGFPEFWRGWRYQIPFFAEAGYRVWAPDQRGYNLSDKPRGVGAYRVEALARDVTGLIDAAGREQAYVVGHDWGAMVGWQLGMAHAERLRKLAILNVPHPAVFSRYLRRDPQQLRRSWYTIFFQAPWLPESLLRLADGALLARSLRMSSRRGTFSDADLAQYRRAWRRPGALTAMLNWYRAAVQTKRETPQNMRVSVPTLLLWGVRDAFLSVEMAAPSARLCDDGRYTLLQEATHWLQHEMPDRVNELLHAFLQEEDKS